MDATQTRPTPEELASGGPDYTIGHKQGLLADLQAFGYVIVHPDDVPVRTYPEAEPPGPDIPAQYTEEANYWATYWAAAGWNNCRKRMLNGEADA